jgi:hypothetical protein
MAGGVTMAAFAFYVLSVVGTVVMIALCTLLVAWLVNALLDWRHEPHHRSFHQGRSHALNELANQAWWFGESPETMQLLLDLSRSVSTWDAREKWRKARSKEETEATT